MIIKRWNYGTCDGCGTICNREIHHWYEPPLLEYHQKMLCRKCNMILTTENVWELSHFSKTRIKWSHILPKWEYQLQLIKANSKNEFLSIRKNIKEAYREFILPENWNIKNNI